MNLLTELPPGSIVQVTYLNHSHKPVQLPLVYVGLIENEYILLRWRNNDTPQEVFPELKSGVQLSLKTVIKKDLWVAINFVSASLGTSVLREPLLLVSYPSALRTQALRHDKRLPVELMAKIDLVDDDRHYLALVTDMSISGLACEYIPSEKEAEDGSYKKLMSLTGHKVNIQFVTDGDLAEDLVLHGEIRNLKIKEKVYAGIQFLTEDQELIKNVFAIVLMRSHGL